MQIANNYSWIKGGSYGKGSDQTSFKPKVAIYTRDPKLLAKAMKSNLGTQEMNTMTMHWKDMKYQKNKINITCLMGPYTNFIVQTKINIQSCDQTQDPRVVSTYSQWSGHNTRVLELECP